MASKDCIYSILFNHVDHSLTVQPPRPTAAELDRRCHTLLGAPIPTSPDANFNRELYNSSGTIITLRSYQDLRSVAGASVFDLPLDDIVFPVNIELNIPWSIGAPGQKRDSHYTFAVYIQASNCHDTAAEPCRFTRFCVPGSVAYDINFANDRALRCIATIPLFKHPKLLPMPAKQEDKEIVPGSMVRKWYPWQTCTNCIAARAKCRCEHWLDATAKQGPQHFETVQLDELDGPQSEYDRSFGWWDQVRDNFMAKDKGFFE